MTEDEEARMDRLEEALRRIVEWADAYPLAAFPKPDALYMAEARSVLAAHGMTLDRISADNMRHVVEGVGKIARTAMETE